MLSNAIAALQLIIDLEDVDPATHSISSQDIGINSSGQPFLLKTPGDVTYHQEFEKALAAQAARQRLMDTASKFLDQVFKLPGISPMIPGLWDLVSYATKCVDDKMTDAKCFRKFDIYCDQAFVHSQLRVQEAKETVSVIQKAGSVGAWTKDTLRSTVELLCLGDQDKRKIDDMIDGSPPYPWPAGKFLRSKRHDR